MVILIGYVILHGIYFVGMFSMRYQYNDESLSSKRCERIKMFISAFPTSWAYIQEHFSPEATGGP